RDRGRDTRLQRGERRYDGPLRPARQGRTRRRPLRTGGHRGALLRYSALRNSLPNRTVIVIWTGFQGRFRESEMAENDGRSLNRIIRPADATAETFRGRT